MSVERTEQYAQVMKRLRELESRVVNVGFFDTAKYEDGTPVAYVAAIQEFGYPACGIPERPFMRPAVADNKDAWGDLYQRGAKRVIDGSLSPDQMLGTIGELAAGNVKEAIVAVTAPPLAPSTVDARARRRVSPGVSTKPLVDTGLMLQSVSSKVTQE